MKKRGVDMFGDQGFLILFIIIGIITLFIMILTFSFIFNPKTRSKLMGKQLGMINNLLNDNKDTIVNINETMGGIMVDSQKSILNKHGDGMKEVVTKNANINKEATKIVATAIKEGFSETEKGYCKHCGKNIDKDSLYCKDCGKKQ